MKLVKNAIEKHREPGASRWKTVFGGEAHKLRQSKSARANYGRHLRSRSLADCAKPQPCSFARHPPLHLHCQACGQRGSGAGCGIARTDPRKSWDRTQGTYNGRDLYRPWLRQKPLFWFWGVRQLVILERICTCVVLSGQKSHPLPKRCWTCRKVLKIAPLFARNIFRREVSLYTEARRI